MNNDLEERNKKYIETNKMLKEVVNQMRTDYQKLVADIKRKNEDSALKNSQINPMKP